MRKVSKNFGGINREQHRNRCERDAPPGSFVTDACLTSDRSSAWTNSARPSVLPVECAGALQRLSRLHFSVFAGLANQFFPAETVGIRRLSAEQSVSPLMSKSSTCLPISVEASEKAFDGLSPNYV